MRTKKKPTMAMQLPGALALAAAGAATQAHAATVQITFLNNYVSSVTGLTNFTRDLTGDGVSDGIRGAASTALRSGNPGAVIYRGLGTSASAFINRSGLFGSGASFARARAGGPGPSWGYVTAVDRGLMAITFSDGRINNGLETSGWMDVEAMSRVGGEQSVRIHRLIFDNTSQDVAGGITAQDAAYPQWSATSAVPEASTSLGLLALGAGGILTRRRSKRAA